MDKNGVHFVHFLFFLCEIFIKCSTGDGFVIQKNFIHIRQINSSHPNELYPERMCISLHKSADVNKNSFLELKLDKYLDNNEGEVTHERNVIYDISERKTLHRYRVNGGHKLIKLHRTVDNDFLINGKFCADGNLIIIKPLGVKANTDYKDVKHYITFHDQTESESECLHEDRDESEEYSVDENINTEFDNPIPQEEMEIVDDFLDTDIVINGVEESGAAQHSLSNAFGKSVKHGNDRVRRTQHLTIELLMVIDYAAYSWWQSVVEDDQTDNSTDAMALIRQFYAFVFQGIDGRFMSIETQPYMIDLAFSGLFVAKTEQESYWTTESIIGDNVDNARVMVNSSEALDKFQKWLDNADFLPSYDHAILFTGTNLTYAGSPGNTGLAFESSMCRNISNASIVEDIFDFRTVTYSTQQIARSLGSRDDMDNNNCLEFFNHIMAPKFKLPIRSFVSNRWKFSSCSEQYFLEYTSELNELGLTCLNDQFGVERYPPDLAKLVTELPGKVYTGKKQCENRFGLQSDICRENIGTSYADICAGLLCTLPRQDRCDYILPADGTPCGNKKYCWHGSCLEFEDAVGSSDTCVFGNDPETNCETTILKERAQCYNESVRYKCCNTCESLHTGISACEYGDRSDDCSMSGCINGDDTYKTVTCCLTCSDGPTPYSPPGENGVTDMFPLQQTPTTLSVEISETSTVPISTTITPSSILHAISSLAAFVEASVGDILSSTVSVSTESPIKSWMNDLDTQTTDVFAETMDATTESFQGKFKDYSADESSKHSIAETAATSESSMVAQLPGSQSGHTPTSDQSMSGSESQGTSEDTKEHVPKSDQSMSGSESQGTSEDTKEHVPTSDQSMRGSESQGTSEDTKEHVPTSDQSMSGSESQGTSEDTKEHVPKSDQSMSGSESQGTSEDTKEHVPKSDQSMSGSESQGTTEDTNEHVTTAEQIKRDSINSNPQTTNYSQCNCTNALPGTYTTSSEMKTSETFRRCEPTKPLGYGSLYDRIFFKDLARSMQNNQRYIKRNLRKSIQSLYMSVTMKLRGGNHEYETENESGREGGEDEDLNRKLLPIWRQNYHDTMKGLESNVREMRYRVLALLNRHFKFRNYRHW